MASRRTSATDASEWVDRTFDHLESARVEGYEMAIRSHQIKMLQLEAESDRLGKKHGKSHPRAQKIASDLDILKQSTFSLDLSAQIIKSQVPLEKTSWRVQGFITDKDQKPVKEWRILLIFPEGQGREESSKTPGKRVTETNNIGFYSFTLTQEEIKMVHGQKLLIHVPDNRTEEKANIIEKEVSPTSGVIDLYNISFP